MELLHDKVVFLTGGSDGIGLACARAYAKEGARVVIVSNNDTRIHDIIEEIGHSHLGIYCDISNEQDVKYAIEKSLEKYGRIDAIHNNAGISAPSKRLHETSSHEWDSLMNTNLKGIYHTTKFGISSLIESKGCILNTSSIVGEIGQENHAAYTASKGGVNALTKSMALDYALFDIRVNAVSPAGVWTPMLHEWADENQHFNSNDKVKYLNEIHPLGYCPEADVVADVCVFLLSEKARFVTGCIMPVSGGAELGYKRTALDA
jgi:NAD(P)-dependent dehydrogenase (short-subunit alcohol dehydrogenase family)